jgi:flavodoxin
MRTLIVFYSRTGTTKRVAEKLAEMINAEMEEIIDTKNRSGAKGYLLSGRDAMRKRLTELKPIGKNPAEYDLMVIGTPIWAWNVSAPVRTFLEKYKDDVNKVAFFCTMGGSGDKNAFSEMEKISGKKPLASLALTTKEVMQGEVEGKLQGFCEEINISSSA